MVTQEFAKKYFGDEDPMGQTLTLDGKFDFKITGILAEIPKNSHLRFDFLGHFNYARNIWGEDRFNRQSVISYTYIQLDNPDSATALEGKLNDFLRRRKGEDYASKRDIYLQPLTSIHLHSHESGELGKNSRDSYSYVLSLIAFIILLIACVNHINLSTARASKRALEVGVRKAVGAGRAQLIRQFVGESVLLSFLAMVIAVFMAMLLLPFFNSVMERDIALDFQGNLVLYLGLFALTFFVGLASGLYPAVYLSSFSPVSILKGRKPVGRRTFFNMRKILVVFQFGLSAVFIIGTLVVVRQIGFIQDRDLGFEHEHIFVLPPPLVKDSGYGAFKAELQSSPSITGVTSSTGSLGSYSGLPFSFFGEGIPESEAISIKYMAVDYDFFSFYGIDFLEGRNFSSLKAMDAGGTVILNESALKHLGWKTAVGKWIKDTRMKETTLVVIGVVKDFHNVSMHEEIQPAIYHMDPSMFGEMCIKAAPGRSREALDFVKRIWNRRAPYNAFYYKSLDETLEALYREDRKVSRVFVFASILTIFISCLGLLGLSIFETEQRVKEIGIRKVLGASIFGIFRLLGQNFYRLILLSNLIVWPFVYYIMRRWLQNFAYHADITIWQFLIGGGISLLVAFAAISFQTLKTAVVDPVDSLRYE